ncbi:MAG: hypothetical protein ACREMQ_18015 [Longimicrobiales bacterium]
MAYLTLGLVLVLTLGGCTQVMHFVPEEPITGVTLVGWPRNRVALDIQDFRADDRDGSEKLLTTLRRSMEAALSPPVATDGSPYRLRIGVVEHRSFFTAGNWNARTRLRATLVDTDGRVVKTYNAIGADSRSNPLGRGVRRRRGPRRIPPGGVRPSVPTRHGTARSIARSSTMEEESARVPRVPRYLARRLLPDGA